MLTCHVSGYLLTCPVSGYLLANHVLVNCFRVTYLAIVPNLLAPCAYLRVPCQPACPVSDHLLACHVPTCVSRVRLRVGVPCATCVFRVKLPVGVPCSNMRNPCKATCWLVMCPPACPVPVYLLACHVTTFLSRDRPPVGVPCANMRVPCQTACWRVMCPHALSHVMLLACHVNTCWCVVLCPLSSGNSSLRS